MKIINNKVSVKLIDHYNIDVIYQSLPDSLFDCIKPGNTVILKPNWVKESHLTNKDEWEHIITHPSIITAVLRKTVEKLDRKGKIIIADGPQTDSSYSKILEKNPIESWKLFAKENGINIELIDLRDDEWIHDGENIVKRTKLIGDPKGKTEVNLFGDASEFFGKKKSKKGYYGADYNIQETNNAHDGNNNLYRVSRSIIEADVFINLPKLKTHKKAGITCCLKNLVGINTYKNFLPHHSIGIPSEGGDQYPEKNITSQIEGPIMVYLKQHFLVNTRFARLFKPLKKIGRKVFGDNDKVIRNGSWYGNDTLWRMVLDLNKILFYSNPNGEMRSDEILSRKKYIGIVDAISAGEGRGPISPDLVKMNKLIFGTNPVAIDAVCAKLMGYDPHKIPSIIESFGIQKFKLCDFTYEDINIDINDEKYNIEFLDRKHIINFKPHFGWIGNIEL